MVSIMRIIIASLNLSTNEFENTTDIEYDGTFEEYMESRTPYYVKKTPRELFQAGVDAGLIKVIEPKEW